MSDATTRLSALDNLGPGSVALSSVIAEAPSRAMQAHQQKESW